MIDRQDQNKSNRQDKIHKKKTYQGMLGYSYLPILINYFLEFISIIQFSKLRKYLPVERPHSKIIHKIMSAAEFFKNFTNHKSQANKPTELIEKFIINPSIC